MSDLGAKGRVKRVELSAVVIRGDRTRVELGTVSDSRWHRISIRKWLAKRRTQRANRSRED